ncbi:adenine DNA glycosylase-like isoform X1 [Typha angustifolia]|uniref:adenine DNA glycosylase-like isoform X1 n=2 Tax=Typha angustifolia TaxID=59011 RepID=UPI003C2C861D
MVRWVNLQIGDLLPIPSTPLLAAKLPVSISNPNPSIFPLVSSMDSIVNRPKRRNRRIETLGIASLDDDSDPPPRRPVQAQLNAVATEDMEDFSRVESESIRASLLQWYDRHHRALPWRTESSKGQSGKKKDGVDERAYAVWVSEVMLQQTRVSVVVEYYNRWMEKWPTIRHLASASQEEVNEMWAGLGYYRRARFLLEGAKAIVKVGEFPRTALALHEVPGIGNYTAGAIASIAFNEVVPVVDGNVVRVISRLKAISANPKRSAAVKGFWKLAGQLVDPSRPGDFNQALMELGATLCSKTSPGCSRCPVSNQCRAFSLSRGSEKVKVTDFPTKVLKAKPRNDFSAVCVVQIVEVSEKEMPSGTDKRNAFLLVKRPEEGLLAGLWEFPSVLLDEELTNVITRRAEMDKYLNKLLNLDVKRDYNVVSREDVGEHVHIFSHIRLRMFVELMILTTKGNLDKLSNNQEECTPHWKYVDENSISSIGLTSGVRKVFNMIKSFKEKQPSQVTRTSRKKVKRLKS